MVAGYIQVSNKRMNNWFKILVLGLVLASCEDRFKEVDTDFGYDYFPLEIGAFKTYDVMEITYNASGPDTTRYELKTTITEMVEEDDTNYFVLKRERRPDELSEWEIADLWTIRRDDFTGVTVEENIPLIKMTFPAELDKTWDGNAFNSRNAAEYRYVSPTSAIYDDLLNGAQKIQVQIADIPQNLVNRDQRYEVYARGIGLVEKNYIVLNYCTANCGSEEVDSGIIIEQILTAYGQE